MTRHELMLRVKGELKALAGEIRWLKRSKHLSTIPIWMIDGHIHVLKKTFRHKHIALCEMKGVLREAIEQPRKGNPANEITIKMLKAGWEVQITE